MKTIRIMIMALPLAWLFSLNVYAQVGRPPHHVHALSADERAESRTQEMHKAVNLDEKQYKKIFRIFLKEENAKESAIGHGGPMGPPLTGSEGRPPQDGGTFGGSGMRGPGAGGPPPAGMPPKGGFPGGEPQKATVGGKDIDSDDYIDSREMKFRKILSPEQYSTWRRLHPDPAGFFIR